MESEGLVFAVARDITESKQAEAALQLSETRYYDLFENLAEGFAYCQMLYEDGEPVDWIYLDVNPAFEEQTGITGAAGRRVSEVIPGIRESDPELFETYSRVALTGEPEKFEMHVEALDLWFDVHVHSPETGYFVALFDVVTDRKKAEAELASAFRTLMALSACNEALVRAENEQELLQDVCDIAVEQGGYLMTWVGRAERDEEKTVRPVAFAGVEQGFLSGARFSWGDTPDRQGPAGVAINSGRPVVVEAMASDPRFDPWKESAVARGFGAVASLPVTVDAEVWGAVTFVAAESSAFEERELALLSELVSDLAYGIETLRGRAARVEMTEQLARSNESLQALLRQVTVALGRVVETRDPYTSGHEERVALLARQIAAELGLPTEDAEAVEVAALVHDIGKLSVPAEILTKPSALSTIEHRLIREHSRAGYDILKDIAFQWPIADIVLQHHERMDGSGYPEGITGDHMLLLARVLAVADVVEAMASHRPYRAALGLDAAVAEVADHPELYDPQIAAACVRLHEVGAIAM
jgi:putative nucleotidyltransferase with HDIG domain